MKIVVLFVLAFFVVACQKLFKNSSQNMLQESRQGRKLNSRQIMTECFGNVSTCVNGCFFTSVQRDCRDEFIVPNIMGSESKEIVAEDFPFLVSFRKSRVDDFKVPIEGCKEHFCGGVLIWYDVVLTAAHCLKELLDQTFTPLPRFNQQIWATRASKCRHLNGMQELISFEAVVHPEFDPETLNNDIAIVFLQGEMDSDFGFIDFIDAKSFDQQGMATVLGYGDTVLESEGIVSIPGRKATLELLSEEKCNLTMPDEISRNTLDYEQMLCVHSFQADTCKGDSGGPLYVQIDENRSVLIGLSSWGPSSQCKATSGIPPPAVFTRVSTYIDWILHNIKSFSVNRNFPVPSTVLDPSSTTEAAIISAPENLTTTGTTPKAAPFTNILFYISFTQHAPVVYPTPTPAPLVLATAPNPPLPVPKLSSRPNALQAPSIQTSTPSPNITHSSSILGSQLQENSNINCSTTMVVGIDYSGTSIQTNQTESAYECQKLCGLMNGCFAFTFMLDKLMCELKSNIICLVKKPNAISGNKLFCPADDMICFSMIDGLGYYGGDLSKGALRVQGPQACQYFCSQTIGCLKFTYDRDDKECWLKGNNYQAVDINSNTLSGEVCKGDENIFPSMIDGLAYKGGDLFDGSKVKSPEECQNNCALTHGCLRFTFDRVDKWCWLKGNNFRRIDVNSNYVSGDILFV